MPLRGAPLPRMAGHLPFMRGRYGSLDDVGSNMIAAFGLRLAEKDRTDLAPLAFRETSAYFGSHFNANMKSAMDIDQRKVLDSASIANLVVDLGDLSINQTITELENDAVSVLNEISDRQAIAFIFGGDLSFIKKVHAQLNKEKNEFKEAILVSIVANQINIKLCQGITVPDESASGILTCSDSGASFRLVDIPMHIDEIADTIIKYASTKNVLLALDASAFACHWHGSNIYADFNGIGLSACRKLFRKIGGINIVCVALTGLDPTRNGLSVVKTGQRLMLTAILDVLYNRLNVLKGRKGNNND
jgi:agmatinase